MICKQKSTRTDLVPIYCSVRIIQTSEIDPVAQLFKCRFDLSVHWQNEGGGAEPPEVGEDDSERVHISEEALSWLPIVRYPNATEYKEVSPPTLTLTLTLTLTPTPTLTSSCGITSAVHCTDTSAIDRPSRALSSACRTFDISPSTYRR